MSRLARSSWSLLIVLAAAASAICCAPAPAPHPNIILICIDTLRADHLPVYGYARDTSPEIDRYFADAEVFENAYTTASFTSASVVSMLSGLMPAQHGIRDFYRRLPAEIEILPDFLATLGYQTAGIVSNTVLTDEALGLANRFDHWDDFVDQRELNRRIYERRASRTTDAALRWLTLVRDPDRPHFLMLHYIDPHAPYRPPQDEMSVHFEHEGSVPLVGSPVQYQVLPGVTDALSYIDGYDEEIAYMDRELGRFLAAYEKQGLLDDALLILTADHGETLLEHDPRFSHSTSIWSEALRVPLLIRWPGAAASRNPTPVSLVDITPTILHHVTGASGARMAGVPVSKRREGDLLMQESWRTAGATSKRMRAAIRHGEKWTFMERTSGGFEPLWHTNLSTDPLESSPGKWTGRDSETRLRIADAIAKERELDNLPPPATRGYKILDPKTAPQLEPHQREALEALGYIQ